KPPEEWTYAPGPTADDFLNAYRIRRGVFQHLFLVAQTPAKGFVVKEDDVVVELFRQLMKLDPIQARYDELWLYLGRSPQDNRYYLHTQVCQVMPGMFDNSEIEQLVAPLGIGVECPARWGRGFDPELEWWLAFFEEVTQTAFQDAHDRIMVIQDWLYQAYHRMLKSGFRYLKG